MPGTKKLLKTRPDLDEESWLKLLEAMPEYEQLAIRGLYRRMLRWCEHKRQTPTRRRFITWLQNERDAVPIKNVDPDCSQCNNERKVISNDFRIPCPDCRPELYAAWCKSRGK